MIFYNSDKNGNHNRLLHVSKQKDIFKPKCSAYTLMNQADELGSLINLTSNSNFILICLHKTLGRLINFGVCILH